MRNHVLIVFLLMAGWAQSNGFVISKLGIEQGLSNNNIVSIVQDRKGFLWIGTRSGLNRFDGNKFKVFKHSGLVENSINSNELNPVFADKNDNIIWVATERDGVNAYNYDENLFRYYSNDNSANCISSNGVTGVSDDKDGNLWLATYNAGVDHLNKKTGLITHYRTTNVKGLGSDYNWCALDDRSGHLYVGHVNDGLSVINLKEHTAINYKPNPADPFSIPDSRVNCITIDSRKRVWIGTNNGLALFSPRTGKFITFRQQKNNPNSIRGNLIRCITEINENSLWIGTTTGGVNILNCEEEMFNNPESVTFQHIPVSDSPNGLSNAYIEAIMQDNFGNIWVGTAGGGLNFIQNRPDFFNRISYLPVAGNTASLSNKLVSGVCMDKAGGLWVSTEERGIDVFRNGVKVRNFNHDNSEVSNNISCAYADSENKLWFGGVDGAIYCINPLNGQVKMVTGFSIGSARVRSIYEDSKKNIWICSDNGIFSLNLKTGEKRSFHVSPNGLTDDVVRSVVEDADGNIWVGSLSGGLCVFTPNFQRIRYFPPGNELYGINHIYKDSQNRIWVGTRYNLICFSSCRDQKYSSFGLKDGFEDNYFHAITEGATANDIWVSTTNGISFLDVKHRRVRNFNKLDGIPLGDYMNAAVTKSVDGTIYFGTQNGVCWFNARNPLPELKLPPVVISNFAISDKKSSYSGALADIPVAETVKLNYDENTFTVSFNIPDYSLNEKVEFSYQLKGLDDDWYNILNNRELTFRNLRPGTYVLNIRSRLRNSEWSDQYGTMTIVIDPPFWFSWWAKMLYLIAAMVSAFYMSRFYKRKLDLENSLYLEKKNHLQEQEMNDERMRFFTNITHELRTPLTLIIGPLEDLKADETLHGLQQKKINSIHRSAKRLLDLINQILEFRKSETRNRKLSVRRADLATLVRDIGQKYLDLNQNPKISFQIQLPLEEKVMYYDTEVLTIVLDNLISNAMKYTLKGRINVELKYLQEDGNHLAEILVADTGFGIATEQLPRIFDRYYQVKGEHQVSGTGIGLALVKNMVDLHEGEISVHSLPEKGTRFSIRLDMDNTYPEAIHADAQEPEMEVAELEIHTENRQLMLVVEDNAEISDYIRDTFAEMFEVLIAENGKAGLDIALRKIPDIIISDIMMPVMDGIELCRRLKEDVRTCHIPVVLLTAKDSLEDKTEGYTVGADSYITKPFSGNLLRSRVSNLLEARKKITQLFSSSIVSKQSMVQDSISKLDNEFIDKLTRIIEENLEIEQLNIAQIAEQMNMSHSSLYRKIKTLTGLSANEFIRKIRMRNAERLLLSCKYSIAEIIYKVGISTPAYFRQCFKDEFGVTPTDYMKNMKGE